MAILETVSKKVYRTLKSVDSAGVKTWNKIAFWTRADQVERLNGANLENELEMVYLRGNKTIYVSEVGNDITGYGSAGSPYATIGKAISMCPKNLNGFSISLNIVGGTYTEDLTINGFSNGRFTIILRGDVTINGFMNVYDCDNSIQFQSLSGYTYTLLINNASTTLTNAINASNIKFLSFVGLNVTINSVNVGVTNGIYFYGGSTGYFSKAVTINNCLVAVMANQGGKISFSEILTGSGNSVGIRAFSGQISYDNSLFSLSAPTLKDLNDGSFITNELAFNSQIATINETLGKLGTQISVQATAPTDTTKLWVY